MYFAFKLASKLRRNKKFIKAAKHVQNNKCCNWSLFSDFANNVPPCWVAFSFVCSSSSPFSPHHGRFSKWRTGNGQVQSSKVRICDNVFPKNGSVFVDWNSCVLLNDAPSTATYSHDTSRECILRYFPSQALTSILGLDEMTTTGYSIACVLDLFVLSFGTGLGPRLMALHMNTKT